MNYTKLIKQLWATAKTEHFPEDANIKKLLAHVKFGLLHQETNKSSKSIAFDSLREALYYQHGIGGKIDKITGYDLENDREIDNCSTVTDRVAL